MNGQHRKDIHPGLEVNIILKKRSAVRRKNKGHCEGFTDKFSLPSTRYQGSLN